MIAILANFAKGHLLPILCAAAFAALIGGFLHYHAETARLSADLSSERIANAQMRATYDRTVIELESLAAEQKARAQRNETTRKEIASAPPSRACSGSTAIRAALNGLRQPGNGHK